MECVTGGDEERGEGAVQAFLSDPVTASQKGNSEKN